MEAFWMDTQSIHPSYPILSLPLSTILSTYTHTFATLSFPSLRVRIVPESRFSNNDRSQIIPSRFYLLMGLEKKGKRREREFKLLLRLFPLRFHFPFSASFSSSLHPSIRLSVRLSVCPGTLFALPFRGWTGFNHPFSFPRRRRLLGCLLGREYIEFQSLYREKM